MSRHQVQIKIFHKVKDEDQSWTSKDLLQSLCRHKPSPILRTPQQRKGTGRNGGFFLVESVTPGTNLPWIKTLGQQIQQKIPELGNSTGNTHPDFIASRSSKQGTSNGGVGNPHQRSQITLIHLGLKPTKTSTTNILRISKLHRQDETLGHSIRLVYGKKDQHRLETTIEKESWSGT